MTTPDMQRPIAAKYLLMADLIHMFLAALSLNMFLFVSTEVPLLFQLAITALIMVVLLRGGAWLVLGAMQISMFFYETRVETTSVSLSTLIQAAYCLAMVAYAAGFRSIRRLLREWLGLTLQTMLTPADPPAGGNALSNLEAYQDQMADAVWLREQYVRLLIRSARIVAIVIIASFAFVRLPFTVPGIQAWWRRTADMNFTLWPGPTAFVLALVCLVVLSYGSWRRLNRSQATLYVKSQYMRDHFRELRSILVRSGQLAKPLQRPLKPAKASAGLVSKRES